MVPVLPSVYAANKGLRDTQLFGDCLLPFSASNPHADLANTIGADLGFSVSLPTISGSVNQSVCHVAGVGVPAKIHGAIVG